MYYISVSGPNHVDKQMISKVDFSISRR
uniref:Uncharacterized protein n=1 Tax=Rhizophora mucronata TaxID=61149 RepID=A0A2P2N7L7_RHIMU